MRICYIDESGDGRRPDPSKPDLPPAFVICGLVVEGGLVADLTTRFLEVKGRYHPGKAGHRALDGILNEVKGSEIRRDIRSDSRRRTRAAFGFLDQITALLEHFDVGIIGRVWIKDRTTDSDERSMYTFSIQNIVEHFQHDLETTSASGLVICDSRSNSLNENVAHSVFTKMFKQSGNAYPNVVEMPVFGHSKNHAGLQLADLITSALVFPLACRTYSQGYTTGPHVDPAYDKLKSRYGRWLRNRQIRYTKTDGKWVGGLTVSDPVGGRSGAALFR